MIEEKKVVGYVRSLRQMDDDCEIQIKLINRYSQLIGLGAPKMFIDRGFVKKRTLKDIDRGRPLGFAHPQATRCYPAWEDMLLEAMNDKVEVIIVDRMERLYGNAEDKSILEKIVQDHMIRILEVENLDWPEVTGIRKVWAYHYYVPNRYCEGIRTATLLNEIGTFYEAVAVHSDWRFCGIYMDSSIDKRREFAKLMQRKDVDVFICKSLYHISRKPLAFLSFIKDMNARGITVISTEEGTVHYDPIGASFLKKN